MYHQNKLIGKYFEYPSNPKWVYQILDIAAPGYVQVALVWSDEEGRITDEPNHIVSVRDLVDLELYESLIKIVPSKYRDALVAQANEVVTNVAS